MRCSLVFVSATLQIIITLTNAISLSDFSKLPSNFAVPITCSFAYSRTIPDCEASDFQNGAACSSGCINGLNVISLAVNTGCPGVIADSNSLLGKVFEGQLVSLLCPNSGATTTSTTSVKTTAAATSSGTPSSQTTTTPSSASNISPSKSTSFSVSTKSAKSSAAGGLGDGTSTSTITQATTSAANGLSTPSSSSTTSARQQQTSAPKTGGGQSAQAQQAAAIANTGGGSLFDIQDAGAKSGTTRILPGIGSLIWASLCALLWSLLLEQ